jgi:mRNA-degrading endonuclease RelE of RelBE toxin-antitoxin system
MNYSVEWEPGAEDELAAIWVANVLRRRDVTAAADRIERALAVDPRRHGRPVAEGLFAIHVPPLRVTYEILDAERMVMIVAVRWRP